MTPRRTPHVLALALLLAAVLGSLAPAGAAARAQRQVTSDRATWVWDRPDPAELVGFLRARGVRDVFVSTPGHLASSPDLGWFTTVRAQTRAAGIRLHALGAEAWWVDDPAAALTWQRQALATGLFDGIHLDIEPWLLDEWATTDRVRLLERYVDLFGALAADTTAPVEADISFWLDQYTVRGQRVDEAVMARVDAVTVMSYRDTVTGPDSITGTAANALDAARRSGTPIRLAVETNDLGSTPVDLKQTFFGESRKVLDRALRSVDTAVGAHPTYRGIAVHDHLGWSVLRAR